MKSSVWISELNAPNDENESNSSVQVYLETPVEEEKQLTGCK